MFCNILPSLKNVLYILLFCIFCCVSTVEASATDDELILFVNNENMRDIAIF